jgi:hypothetical protein
MIGGDIVGSASPTPISAETSLALDCASSRIINGTCICNTASISFFILLSWLSILLKRASIVRICFLIRARLQMRTAATTNAPTTNALYSPDINQTLDSGRRGKKNAVFFAIEGQRGRGQTLGICESGKPVLWPLCKPSAPRWPPRAGKSRRKRHGSSSCWLKGLFFGPSLPQRFSN